MADFRPELPRQNHVGRLRPGPSLRLWLQPVAHAVHRLDVLGMGRILLESLAQSGDVGVEGARTYGRHAPDLLEEFLSGYRIACTLLQDLQELRLGGGQRGSLSLALEDEALDAHDAATEREAIG